MSEITEQHRQNLRGLAEYLLKLPESYLQFEMQLFSEDDTLPYGIQLRELPLPTETLHTCTTAGCAIGHGPAAGFAARPTESWMEYSHRYFCPISTLQDNNAWEWMFDEGWAEIDNTPHGAATRILWFLDHGLPENWEDQQEGNSPLCYGILGDPR